MPIRGSFDFQTAEFAQSGEATLRATNGFGGGIWIDGWARELDDAAVLSGHRTSGALANAIGDFALVAWSPERATLWLARSPLASRPLFFRYNQGRRLEFSSLAADLAWGAPRCNLDAVARWYGALVGTSIGCMFEAVERVEPGTVVRIDAVGREVLRFWDARHIETNELASDPEFAVGLRDALERAVADCLFDEGTATLLSAGRDSGSVSAVAATLQHRKGQTVDCYTASPGPDQMFHSGPLLMDEAPGARLVAARYANIRHHVVTPRGVRLGEALEQLYPYHSAPLGNPLSLFWWMGIQERAAQAGAKVLLTGGMGNLTVSDGGPGHLADLFRIGQLRQWWSAAKQVAAFEGASWLNIANVSFGGRLPQPAYDAIQRIRSRYLPSRVTAYLKGDLRERVRDFHREQDQRPPARPKQLAQDMLTTMELGDITADQLFGLSVRDPTADRRVVEAMFAIPAGRLVSRYDRRPIFELAFGDLLPQQTIRAPRRGYQSMDWNFAYDLLDLRDGLRRYSDNPLVQQHLDVDAMAKALDRWPTGRLATLEEMADLGEGLLRAFALAAFFHVNFPA